MWDDESVMRPWLESALASMTLPEETRGYLLGRGVRESCFRELGVVLWDESLLPAEYPPDSEFPDLPLEGRLAIPLYCPRGRLLGLEGRNWDGTKGLAQYRLPEASWNPVFLGLTPRTMAQIWGGCDIWIVEGLFDLGPLSQVVPEGQVVLATLRAKLNERHALFLHRFCKGWVNMVYDNDETGQRQTHGYTDPVTKKHRWGALDLLKRVGVRARAVSYRGGKDPGEIWDKGGVEALRRTFTR